MKQKKAFTLIELLVVIAIIGVIATISIIALSNARAKSRDAKRAGDMKQVQTALELFFNDNNRYPTAEEFALGSIFSTSSGATSTYMQIIPSAPTPADGSCTSGQNTVYYQQTENGNSYTISFCLGNTTGTLTAGPKCLTPAGIIDTDCSAGAGALSFVCGENVIDSRDGKSYPTVPIGTQCWMAKSLDVGTRVDALSSSPCTLATVASQSSSNYAYSCQQNDSQIEKYCYNNDDNKCLEYGGLYEWTEAMQLPVSCANVAVDCDINPSDPCCNYGTPRQGICPTGWHIPSNAEYQALFDIFGGISLAGDALKEVGFAHWDTDNTTATNISGFTALAAGRFGKGGFNSAPGSSNGAYNMLWTSDTEGDLSGRAYIESYHGSDVDLFGALRDRGMSVRCVADQAVACTPDCAGKCGNAFDSCGGTCGDTCSGSTPYCWSDVCWADYCDGVTAVTYDGGPHAGQYYTASIYDQCWLKESLNIGTQLCSSGTTCMIEPDDSFSYSNVEKYCYENNLSYCSTYGALYSWAEFMGLPNKCGGTTNYSCDGTTCVNSSYPADCNYPDPALTSRRGACPSGWHVPISSEILHLSSNLGGNAVSGAKMKDNVLWDGTNYSNFTGLPGGSRNSISGGYYNLTVSNYFWLAIPSADMSNIVSLHSGLNDFVVAGSSYKNSGMSARCIKD